MIYYPRLGDDVNQNAPKEANLLNMAYFAKKPRSISYLGAVLICGALVLPWHEHHMEADMRPNKKRFWLLIVAHVLIVCAMFYAFDAGRSADGGGEQLGLTPLRAGLVPDVDVGFIPEARGEDLAQNHDHADVFYTDEQGRVLVWPQQQYLDRTRGQRQTQSDGSGRLDLNSSQTSGGKRIKHETTTKD